jgi:hypothetical protein
MDIERTSSFPLSQTASSASVQTFALPPELLSADMRLLLDSCSNTVILLHLQNADLAASHSSFQLTPSAMRVFLLLLQAYPAYCSYRSLFLALYPLAGSGSAAYSPCSGCTLARTPWIRFTGCLIAQSGICPGYSGSRCAETIKICIRNCPLPENFVICQNDWILRRFADSAEDPLNMNAGD